MNMKQCIALNNGYQLDFSKISNDEMIKASVETFNLEYGLMSKILLKALSIME